MHLVKKVLEAKSSCIAIQDHLFPSVSNVITAFVFGKRFAYEDPRRKYLDERLQTFFKAVRSGSYVTILPGWLKDLAERLSFLRGGTIVNTLLELTEFVRYTYTEYLREGARLLLRLSLLFPFRADFKPTRHVQYASTLSRHT